MSTKAHWMVCVCALGIASFGAGAVSAQEETNGDAPTLEEVAALAQEAALAGHNAWMLTCCALVLFMTAPGLAMFYGGLVRTKNVLGVMMQCLFLMGLMTVLLGVVRLFAGVWRRQSVHRQHRLSIYARRGKNVG